LPILLFLLSYNIQSCLHSPSKSVNVWNEIGSVDPRKSADMVSYSIASSTKLCWLLTYYSRFFNLNVSFHTACFPASSATFVLMIPLPYLNWINGSYFPNVSASFKNLASTIVISSVHFLFKGNLSLSLLTTGGSGSFHIYWVSNRMFPTFFYFLSSRSRLCNSFSVVSKSVLIDIPSVSPNQSQLPISWSYDASTNYLSFWTYFSKFSSTKTSLKTACFPASSSILVLYSLSSQTNLMNGSCLPKVSASFSQFPSIIFS